MDNALFPIVIFIVVMAATAAVLEWVRVALGVPVSIGDVIYTPVALYVAYLNIKNNLSKKSRNKFYREINITRLPGKIVVGCLSLTSPVVGFFVLMIGIADPFRFHSYFNYANPGYSAIFHGYTFISIGILLIVLGPVGMYLVFKKNRIRKHNPPVANIETSRVTEKINRLSSGYYWEIVFHFVLYFVFCFFTLRKSYLDSIEFYFSTILFGLMFGFVFTEIDKRLERHSWVLSPLPQSIFAAFFILFLALNVTLLVYWVGNP